MAKPEWGKKRICPACNTKYYDFNKSPIICPSCGIEFDPDIYLKSRKGKNLSTKAVSEKKQNMSQDMTNIDDIETDTDDEVVSDDDPLLDINTKNQETETEAGVELNIDEDISFIDEDDINEDDDVNEEIIDEKK
ncbi:TIGR02300 family protein [Alphaproteobacteria bacterium]|nr:TIGR02300 family protein [Alphaproteobacteria bacterium]